MLRNFHIMPAFMVSKRAVLCALVLAGFTLMPTAVVAQTPQQLLIEASRAWLKSISAGDRAKLDAMMDPLFFATTPAGDIVSKDRLVPSDPSQAVQRLPALDLEGPMVRVYGETGVVMARLKPETSGPILNGTFVFGNQNHLWKLVALQLSPQK